MEVNDKDRIIISKPIPSRPNFTGIRLELLAGSINVSPPPTNMCSETSVAAIKPKTVRVKPTISQAQLAKEVQAEASEAAPNCKSNYTLVDTQSTIFKPLAKVVSKATISLLANLRNSDITNQQAPSQVNASARPDKLLHYSNRHSSLLSQTELSQSVEPRKMAEQVLDGEPRVAASSATVADRRSSDGYNWRKYGQKQVKGSDYPRSYYKCTHPKCAMKKKVERSLDGQIKEIVYKGEHNHPKLDHSKHNISEIQVQQLANAGTDQEHNRGELKFHENIGVENEGFERQMGSEDSVKISNSWLFGNYAPLYYHPVDIEEHKAGDRTAVDPAGCGRGCEEAAKELKVDDNVTKKKRRKRDNQKNEAGKSGKTVRDPRVLVHNNSETEIIRDGFRWRKYGQKVVRGNPYPRSYYRCNVPKCNVRKHVERALDDPGTFITTYEGRHNHEMPMKILSNSTAELEALIP